MFIRNTIYDGEGGIPSVEREEGSEYQTEGYMVGCLLVGLCASSWLNKSVIRSLFR